MRQQFVSSNNRRTDPRFEYIPELSVRPDTETLTFQSMEGPDLVIPIDERWERVVRTQQLIGIVPEVYGRVKVRLKN